MHVGDVVELKSGGPEMTVIQVFILEGEPKVACDWFDGNERRFGTFPPAVLEIKKYP